RGAFEANLMLFCFFLGIWSYLKIKENKNYVFLSLITFALSLYAYHAAKILTPLIILGLLIFFKNYLVGLTRKKLWLGISLFLLMIIPIIYASLFAGGQQRFSEVSFINNEKVVDQIIIKRLDDNHGSSLIRL
ncbi:MAG: hypothetical protein NTV20_00800, partial [Candidatus Shapirobacteria bacterium]|nr:hypothetical protein [Candidatus Shapirobacteria bacterium]